METKNKDVKNPLKHLTGHTADQGQQYKAFRSQSKDKINGKIPFTVYTRNKNSKVPRVGRVPSSNPRIGTRLDSSGDNQAGTSRIPKTSTKYNISHEKVKQSHIPRRKTSFQENHKQATGTNKLTRDTINPRIVQRIQLLINQDFRPEQRVPNASLATTRPIPTLGQIYARNNVIDTDRFDEWFVELDTPANSMASNFFINSRLVDAANVENAINRKCRTTTVSNVEYDATSTYRTTDENVRDWLSAEMEYPTRDNESGYQSLSPPAHSPREIRSKQSKCSLVSGRNENIPEKNEQSVLETISKRSSEGTIPEDNKDLKEQPTVVLAKIPSTPTNQKSDSTSTTATESYYRSSKIGDSKNYNYASNSVREPIRENLTQVTVPSYEECPSEVLQKTTNFEDMMLVCDSPILSSITGTDLEIRDDLSSQFTIHADECSIDDRCNAEWYHNCRSCGRNDTMSKNTSEETSVAESLICHYNDDFLESPRVERSDANSYVHHYRWKKYQGHCKKCQRYRRFPSTRYKLPKAISSLRRRMSLRLCRGRLSRVWKKTAERWAMWSAKSPQKFRKLRVMHYLQRSIVWEDAHVQTNIFVYRETGTEPVSLGQKSAAVSTILKFRSSVLLRSSLENHTLSKHIQEKPNSIGKENDVDSFQQFVESKSAGKAANEKIAYHVITQTKSNVQPNDAAKSKENEWFNYDKPLNESASVIEISEVSVDDKTTGTEDMTSPLKDNVTNTLVYLDSIPTITENMELQNAYTQNCIVCNNAETDITFLPTREITTTSVLTAISDDIALSKTFGTNTDSKHQQSVVIMTSKMSTKNSNHIATQVTPVQSLNKLSTGVITSKSFVPSKFGTEISTEMGNNMENISKDFSNQAMTQPTSVMNNNTTSTPATDLTEACAVTSQKEFSCAEVTTYVAQKKSGICLTSPSLDLCGCLNYEKSSQGTNTNGNKCDFVSKNKLKTYFNTGMLINTLVEDAVFRGGPKSSISTNTKSFGNEYTTDIGTCTNSELNGPVIEREKERYPARLTVDTSACIQQETRSTDQHEDNWLNNMFEKKIDSYTQFSDIVQEAAPCRSDRIGQSRLLSARTLSHSADETAAQTDPVRIDGLLGVPQTKCASMFTSRCVLDLPIKQAATCQDFGLTSRKKSKPIGTSNFPVETSAILSSDLGDDQWIKSFDKEIMKKTKDISVSETESTRYYGDRKDYLKFVDCETQSISHHVPSNNKVTTVASAITDVALEKYTHELVPITYDENQITKMADIDSPDIKKEVKEMTLQACPETNETVPTPGKKPESKFSIMLKLDSSIKSKCTITINFSKSKRATECKNDIKSVSVYTSHCVLPAPPLCKTQQCKALTGDCLFVYGKPRCVVHSDKEYADISVQNSRSPVQCPYLTQMPSERILQSFGMLTSHYEMASLQTHSKDDKMLPPKVYEALYETTKLIAERESKLETQKAPNCNGIDAGVEVNLLRPSEMCSAAMLTSLAVQSAAVVTSQCGYCDPVPRCDHFTQEDSTVSMAWRTNFNIFKQKLDECTQTSFIQQARVLEIPTNDYPECLGECVKTHLVASCRYYSNLLTEQLDRVRENLTKHLAPSVETSIYELNNSNSYIEAGTMKPSAREEIGCQTFKTKAGAKRAKYNSTLSPAVSVTNICRHDQEHLKSVYFMLTAIEGRMRRFKASAD